MSLGTILLIIVVLLLLGVLPTWGHSRSWGYGPSGGIGLVLVILLILVVLGKISRIFLTVMARRPATMRVFVGSAPGLKSGISKESAWRGYLSALT